MNTEMRELTIDELDAVSGGTAIPGGDVSKSYGGTVMTFGSVRIFVSTNGSLTTSDSNGNRTTTNPTNPLT